MNSPSTSSRNAVGVQDAAAASTAVWMQAWLSLYGACCTEEGVAMHPVVLARVLQTVTLLPSREWTSSQGDGAPVATTARHACRCCEEDAVAATGAQSSPTEPRGERGNQRDSGEAGVSVDFGGLWLPLSEWIAALRSVAAAVPLRSFSLRDTALGDAGLLCLCRQVTTASVKPASMKTGGISENGCAHLPGPSPLPAPLSYSCPVLGLCAMSALRSLDLEGANLTDGAPLASLVMSCSQLRSLNISCNRLGVHESGLASLCAALQLHPSLEVLRMRRNCISGCRGGPAIAALAELIVAQSAKSSRTHVGSSDPASITSGLIAQPLRRLDLSDNLLGTYFFPPGMTKGRCDGGEARSTAVPQYGMASLDGHHLGAHEAVASFPLITALCLNNTLLDLDLRGNGLPEALLKYAEARLRVNQRTTGCGADSSATSSDLITCTTVRQALSHRLQCTLNEIGIETKICSGVLEAKHAVSGDSHSAANQASGYSPAERRWSTDELVSLLHRFVDHVTSDLMLC
ncbi:hypothetical protein JKF63_05278 [Porcisia hertigi]|uniref:Uncharacterized protein n=1 Tax=Porcisia hertigi TaxID=2761500 RepID=A0A836IYB8_9TRYP|nr:hypothetical protein JKF63_05278 [Porcisia hertigi]